MEMQIQSELGPWAKLSEALPSGAISMKKKRQECLDQFVNRKVGYVVVPVLNTRAICIRQGGKRKRVVSVELSI